MIDFFFITLLLGQVSYTSEPGRIGILWNIGSHRIERVFNGSPAEIVGLQKGDRIISWVDEDGSTKNIEGESYTKVSLTIERQSLIKTYTIERLPISVIKQRDKEERNK
jgi:C-terminal processing protease CtpA/Prc